MKNSKEGHGKCSEFWVYVYTCTCLYNRILGLRISIALWKSQQTQEYIRGLQNYQENKVIRQQLLWALVAGWIKELQCSWSKACFKWYTKSMGCWKALHKAYLVCDCVRDNGTQSEALRQEFPANNSCGFKSKNGNLPRYPV